jgi:elongation factor G
MAEQRPGICNLALVGHGGAGKTTLAETLLHSAGAIRAKGSVARGSTVCDFDPQEKRLQHSLDAAVCGFELGGRRVNLIDTPGLPDFAGRAAGALAAVETAAIVVNASTGPELMTHRMMADAKERGLCRLLIVNRIDALDARPADVLAELREAFGRECLPMNLPADQGRRVVDCYFNREGPATDFSSVAQAHEEIIDQVVEVDEALMATYLEQGEALDLEQLHPAFEQALRDGHLVPVCFVSATSGAGIAELLRILAELAPTPEEGNAPPFLVGEGSEARPAEVRPDAARHVLAHVFKVVVDPFVGKLGVFRVHQGTIRPGQQLYIGSARKAFRVAHLLRLQGKETREVPSAGPGDICAVAKIDDMHFDAVLHDSHDEDHYHLRRTPLPPAMLGVAIEPERRGDEQRLADALHKLAEEDSSVRIEMHGAQNETVLYGMGELHLRCLLERMSERFSVAVKTRPPGIPYRESINASAEALHRHKKQTGGAGQFAEVRLKVEPLARGQGFEFVDDVVGGAIPKVFIPAVEKGVRQVLGEGVVAGFPMQDLRVTLLDGKHHPVDSKEIAFVIAGRRAFQEAIAQATPVVLEPVVRADIVAPSSAQGEIAADLATRRGRVTGSQSLPGQRVSIGALAPLAELIDYHARLKSATGGEGSYTLDLSHYEPVQARKQAELVQAHVPRHAEH